MALKGHEIITCGWYDEADFHIYTEPAPSIKRKVTRLFWLLSGQFEKFFWDENKKKLAEKLRKVNPGRIIANDIYTLPLALSISNKVYFDAHEYHPKEWGHLKWKLLHKRYVSYLCKKYIPLAYSFSTVSESLANEYNKFLGRKPEVVTNAANYLDLKPAKIKNQIRIVHHGVALPSRDIEFMIKILDYLDQRFTLDFFLTYIPETKSYYQKLVSSNKNNFRVHFNDSVPYSEICPTLNKYDIGIGIQPPVSISYIYSLPNKFFEFIQARLCLVFSPSSEMEPIIKKYNLGAYAKQYSPQSMAEAILKVSEKIEYYKNQSDKYAKELSAENNYSLIQKLIQ